MKSARTNITGKLTRVVHDLVFSLFKKGFENQVLTLFGFSTAVWSQFGFMRFQMSK